MEQKANFTHFLVIPLHRQTRTNNIQIMAEYKLKTGKVAKAVTKGYKAIEDGVVGSYKTIEEGVVKGYKRIEKGFVERFLEEVGEREDGTEKEDK